MRLNYYEKYLKNFASEYIDNAVEKNYSHDFVTPFFIILSEKFYFILINCFVLVIIRIKFVLML